MRTLPLACALVAWLTACGSGVATTAPTPVVSFPPATTVTYCTDGGEALTLDILEPTQPGGAPHPLLVVVHGGSWSFGSSAMAAQSLLTKRAAAVLLQRGFVVASINYRFAPRDPWPAQIIDTRCAVRYLRATAPRWNVDPHRFVALGNSSGAQMVSLDALSAGQEPQWDNGQYSSESSAVAAVVDLWGPVDLTASGWSEEAIQIGNAVFKTSLGTDSDALQRASPVTHIRPGAPPFLIIQGTADMLVPPTQATEIHDRLVAAGDAATLIDVAHAAHELRPSGGAISPSIEALAAQVVAFAASVG